MRRGAAAHDDNDEDNDEERKRVMDMLRKWQLGGGGNIGEGLDWQGILGGEDEAEEEDDEDDEGTSDQDPPDHLTEDDLPTDEAQLLALLDDDQRRIFLDAVKQEGTDDVRSGVHPSDRARQLWDKLHSSDNTPYAPRLWWTDEDSERRLTLQPAFSSSVIALAARKRTPQSPWQVGISWNIIALLLAYVYTLVHLDIRSLCVSDDGDEEELVLARTTIASLCSFLTAPPGSPESKTLLTNASEVTLYILDQLGEERRSESPSALVLFLYERVLELFSKSRIVSSDADDDLITLALQDIHDLFHTHPSADQATSRKIIFYAAHYQRGRHLFSSVVLGANGEKDSGLPPTHSSSSSLTTGGHTKTVHQEVKALQEEVDAAEAHQRFDAAFAWQTQTQVQPQVQAQRGGGKEQRHRQASSAQPLIQSLDDDDKEVQEPQSQAQAQFSEQQQPSPKPEPITHTQPRQSPHPTSSSSSSSFKTAKSQRQMRTSSKVAVFQPTDAKDEEQEQQHAEESVALKKHL